jgi:YbgC/YbaW family acyl-CoA thioester hydrolase
MMEKEFISKHKVRAFECDFYGHVNNATYLNYLEFARMEVLESCGIYLPTLKQQGVVIVVREITIRYIHPAVFGDTLVILSGLETCSKTNGTFWQQIKRESDQKLLAKAKVNWVVVNSVGRPVRIPAFVLEALGIQL